MLHLPLGCAIALSCLAAQAQRAPGAPAARVDNLVEQHHGVAVPDPYRYLENVTSPEVQAWLRAQGNATAEQLAGIEERDAIARRIAEVTAASGDRIQRLVRLPGERYIYLKRARGERQFSLVVRQGLGGSERTLVDPEVEMRATGVPHAIDHFSPSWDGRYVAFGMSAGGSENATLHVVDVATGQRVGEPLRGVPYDAARWLPDSRSFTVNQVQPLRDGQPESDTYKNTIVLWQRVGAPAQAARPVFGPTVSPELRLDPLDNGQIITAPGSPWMVARTTDTTVPEGKLFVAPLAQLGRQPVKWQRLASADDKIVDVQLRGHDLFFLTHANAPRHKLLKLDLRRAKLANATVVVPEPATGVIERFQLKRQGLVTQMREGTALKLRYHAPGDATGRLLPQPYPGAAWLTAHPAPQDEHTLFVMTRWSRWQQTFLARGDTLVPVSFGAEPDTSALDVQVTDVEVPSHDGVRVPLTVLHRKGLALDGSNPVLLIGYGSYGMSVTAVFSPETQVWLERGGVLAFANPRGSGAHGKAWHLAGRKSTKPNTWKDGIACARWLIAQGYGSPATMAIKGTSAGGIFVGRAVTEAPDLFAAAIFDVGALDTVRSHQSANGVTNMSEFGNPADAAEFRALLEMSTLNAIRDGVAYPAVMLVHGLNDPRVPVWESAKTAARLQAASSSGKPVMLRLDAQAGHGLGSTLTQRTSSVADQYSFLLWQMGKLNKRD